MNDFQEWCKRMMPIFKAASEGKKIEVLINGVWTEKKVAGMRGPHREYRIKE